MKPTVYIETSVISYYTARISRDLIVAGHQQITQEWWETVLPNCEPVVSQAVLDEIARGDPVFVEKRVEAVQAMRVLPVVDEVAALAAEYFVRLGMPESARTDSVHLAAAVWHRAAYMVTWNCTHMATPRVRRILDEINRNRGIATPGICTPEELMEP